MNKKRVPPCKGGGRGQECPRQRRKELGMFEDLKEACAVEVSRAESGRR